MRITTVFFRHKLNGITSNLMFWLNKITYLAYIGFLSIMFTFFISNIYIDSNIFALAGNAKVQNNDAFTFASLKNIFPVFNDSSYIVRDSTKSEVITVSNERKSEYDIIDNINVDEAISVFSNKVKLEVTSTDTSSLERVNVDTMKILNYSSLRNIDYQKLYDKTITLTKLSDKILLYNTHTSESYANSEKYKFGYTGTYRTTDAKYNMISVASELQKNLKEKKLNVIQDTTPHDYATYTSAYVRSKLTVAEEIKANGNFGVSMDVHRDASGNLDFAPKVDINGVVVAQCMFVIGVGTDKNRNQYYEDNLALAVQIQLLAEKIYPGLFRPMYVRDYVYNQDLNKYSLLLEVGATGNTLEEAYLATRCISNLLDIIYKK